MQTRKAVAPPLAQSNLTGLDDLAAAAYTVTATEAVFWADLPDHEQARWRTAVAYLLDIALPYGCHDQSPEMERIRLDGVSARHIAEIQMQKAIDHEQDMKRILAGR